MAVQNSKTGHLTLTKSLSWMVFVGSVGLAMTNLYTKFEVSRFIRYEVMNGGEKCIKLGGLGWLLGTQVHGQCHHSI